MTEINKMKREFYERSTPILGRICLKIGLTPNMLTALAVQFMFNGIEQSGLLSGVK